MATIKELIEQEETILRDIFYTGVEGGIEYWAHINWDSYNVKECQVYIWDEDAGKHYQIDTATIKLGLLELNVTYLQFPGYTKAEEGSDVHRLAERVNKYGSYPFPDQGTMFVDEGLTMDGEGIDAGDADIILQFALFGELVYN